MKISKLMKLVLAPDERITNTLLREEGELLEERKIELDRRITDLYDETLAETISIDTVLAHGTPEEKFQAMADAQERRVRRVLLMQENAALLESKIAYQKRLKQTLNN